MRFFINYRPLIKAEHLRKRNSTRSLPGATDSIPNWRMRLRIGTRLKTRSVWTRYSMRWIIFSAWWDS